MHSHPALDESALERIGIWEDEGEIVAGAHYETALGEAFPRFTRPIRSRGLGQAAVLEGIRRCGELGAIVAYVGSDLVWRVCPDAQMAGGTARGPDPVASWGGALPWADSSVGQKRILGA